LTGNPRGAILLGNPLPPLGIGFLCPSFPVSLSPEHLLAYNSASLGPGGRPLQSGRILPWTAVTEIEARARTVFVNGERWLAAVSESHARQLVRWFERVRATTLYRYEMPDATFSLKDNHAGHWISRESVVPLTVEAMPDLLGALINAGVELRITPSLIDLWQRVIASTLAFSGTRLRNAQGYHKIAHLRG
jgi:hypothetical protein